MWCPPTRRGEAVLFICLVFVPSAQNEALRVCPPVCPRTLLSVRRPRTRSCGRSPPFWTPRGPRSSPASGAPLNFLVIFLSSFPVSSFAVPLSHLKFLSPPPRPSPERRGVLVPLFRALNPSPRTPPPPADFRFERFSFGSIPARIEGVKARQTEHRNTHAHPRLPALRECSCDWGICDAMRLSYWREFEPQSLRFSCVHAPFLRCMRWRVKTPWRREILTFQPVIPHLPPHLSSFFTPNNPRFRTHLSSD